MGIYRPTRTKGVKSSIWWGKFRHPKGRHWVYVNTRTADKSAARVIFADAQRRAAMEMAGLISPWESHERTPLLAHLEEFRAGMAAKGNTGNHVRQTYVRTKAVIDACQFAVWKDVNAAAVQTFIGCDLRARRAMKQAKAKESATYSARTRNDYLRSIKQFCRWMIANGRAGSNPLLSLSPENAKADRRVKRRALSRDELVALIDHVRKAGDSMGMTGECRALLYSIATTTGFRANEIASLTWGCLNLGSNPPTATVPAGYSKRRRDDTLPLKPFLAQWLGRWKAQAGSDVPADQPVIPISHRTNLARVVRADLQSARAAWLAAAGPAERKRREGDDFLRHDSGGNVVDFHALRHTFGSNLARAGVAPKAAMDLMRHSDVNLTMGLYSHTVIGEQSAALEVLPDLDVKPVAAARAG